jgi:hypothetical protein
MNVMKLSILFLLFFTAFQLQAQSYLGLSVSTSKNDNHMETIWYQNQISERFSAGIQLRYSGIKYRFVNARAIKYGNTVFIGGVLGFKLKQSEKYRLDFNLTASYRYLNNDENTDLPSSANGLELDPNIVFGLRISDNFRFHSGAMFRTAMQFGEEAIMDEQLPYSAIILNGLSFHKNGNTFSLRTYSGPMNGATGDTEKFFWQFSLGYQHSFGATENNYLTFFNF